VAKVFVYGTLKRGYGNNRLLTDSKFVGEGQTVARCRLFDSGFPVLRPRLKKRDGAWNAPVRGEVYEVSSAEVMQRLDQLEGEGFMYHRRKKKIKMDSGETIIAHAYVGDAKHFRHSRIYPAPDGAYDWQRGTRQWYQTSEQHSSASSLAE
jgi:gamma-glutamylaminecyclotransferase